jgi:hypothetical protein
LTDATLDLAKQKLAATVLHGDAKLSAKEKVR